MKPSLRSLYWPGVFVLGVVIHLFCLALVVVGSVHRAEPRWLGWLLEKTFETLTFVSIAINAVFVAVTGHRMPDSSAPLSLVLDSAVWAAAFCLLWLASRKRLTRRCSERAGATGITGESHV